MADGDEYDSIDDDEDSTSNIKKQGKFNEF